MATPFAICTFCLIFFMDETPRYLVSKKKFADAKRILAKISQINKRPPFKFKLNGEIEDDNTKFFITLNDGAISIGGMSYADNSYMSCKSVNVTKQNPTNQRLGL